MNFSELNIVRLGEIILSANTGLDAIKRAPIVQKDTGVKCLRIQDISQRKNVSDWGFCEVNGTNYNKFQLKKNDIIIARTGETVGVNKIIKDDLNAVFNNGLIRIRVKEDLLYPLFLYYSFQSTDFKNHIHSIAHGTSTQPNMRIESLLDYNVNIPSIETQQRIASILCSIDDKIELNRQTNKTLETIAQTLFKEMCLPKGEELPEGWEVGVLFDVCKLIGGGTPKTDKIEYWENGNIDWISAKDITPNNGSFIIGTEKKITELGLKNSSAKLLPKLATIISARGTVGNVCIISKPMTISQSNYSLVAIYPNTEYYLFCIVLSLVNQLRQRAYGTIFDTITTNSLSDLEIIIPRKEILLNFNKIITPIFEQIRSNIEENQTLTTLRDSLLPKLMKGEINV